MKHKKTLKLFEPTVVKQAVGSAFIKLNPIYLLKNPVMFTVEIGTIIMVIVSAITLMTPLSQQGSFIYNFLILFNLQIVKLEHFAKNNNNEIHPLIKNDIRIYHGKIIFSFFSLIQILLGVYSGVPGANDWIFITIIFIVVAIFLYWIRRRQLRFKEIIIDTTNDEFEKAIAHGDTLNDLLEALRSAGSPAASTNSAPGETGHLSRSTARPCPKP